MAYRDQCGERYANPNWFDLWLAQNCPNGYCICNPAKGIVCGQHDTRRHRLSSAGPYATLEETDPT